MSLIDKVIEIDERANWLTSQPKSFKKQAKKKVAKMWERDIKENLIKAKAGS